jgi:hypothetical protein
MYASNVISNFAPSQHQIQRTGLGYSRALSDDELIVAAPSIFAPQAHDSRSDRYAYIPTLDLVAGMRAEGFMPVKVTQAKARDEDRKGFCKHLIRFRRDDQMAATEAREVVLLNSHDGSSGFRLMAGIFRLVCANGLITGQSDHEIRIRHSGDAVGKVIEGAYSIVKDFDRVGEQIEAMKAITLQPEQQQAFGKAALALRFEDPANCGIQPAQVIRPRRTADQPADLWTTFNVAQENLIRGGLRGRKYDEHGHLKNVSTRTVNGIDQNVALNRGLWVLAEEMRKLAA